MTIIIRPLLSSFSVIGKPTSLKSRHAKRQWQSLVSNIARTNRETPFEASVKLDLRIDWFSQISNNKADVDNIIKPIMDALIGVIYVDDSQVTSVSARYYDVNNVLYFVDEPLGIIEPLLSGEKNYVYIRMYRVQ